jgi:hypothetical protein
VPVISTLSIHLKYVFNPARLLLYGIISFTISTPTRTGAEILLRAITWLRRRDNPLAPLQTDLDAQEIAVQRRAAIERRVPERQLTRQSTWTCRFESNLEFSSSACSSQSWPIGGLLPGEEHGDVAWPMTQWCVHKSVTRHHCREVFAKDLGRRQTADLLHRFHWRRLPPDLCRRRLNYRSPNPIRSTNKSQIHHNTHDTRMR